MLCKYSHPQQYGAGSLATLNDGVGSGWCSDGMETAVVAVSAVAVGAGGAWDMGVPDRP